MLQVSLWMHSFSATGAEAIATPLSGGAAAIAIPATAAAAVVCTADGCRVFNNYLNQRPVEQATSNNDAGGGEVSKDKPKSSQYPTESKPNSGAIKKFDEAAIKKRYEKHIFSDEHRKDGIMSLGNSESEIMNEFVRVIKKLDTSGNFVEGSKVKSQFLCTFNFVI